MEWAAGRDMMVVNDVRVSTFSRPNLITVTSNAPPLLEKWRVDEEESNQTDHSCAFHNIRVGRRALK